MVGRSHDEEVLGLFVFKPKVLWVARERIGSTECHDLITFHNFSLPAPCGSYYKWAGHKGKYGDQFGPSFSNPVEKWQWLGSDWQHKFGF